MTDFPIARGIVQFFVAGLCLVGFNACGEEKLDPDKSNSGGKNRSVNAVSPETEEADPACLYLRDFHDSIGTIEAKPRVWLHGNDSCVLSILDSLVTRVRQKDGSEHVRGLAAVASIADGYIAEALCLAVCDLFEEPDAVTNIVRFLSDDPDSDSSTTNAFRDYVVECLKVETGDESGYISRADLKASLKQAPASAETKEDSAVIVDLGSAVLGKFP